MQVATSTLPSFPRFRLALAGRRLTSMSWTDSPIVDALCCHPSNSVWPLRSRSERRPPRGVSHVDTNLWHSLPLERRPRSCCSAPPPPLSPGSACRPYHVAFQQAVFDRLRSPSSLGKAAQSLLPEDERQFSCPSLGAQPQRATTQIVRVDEPDFLSSVTA